MARKLARNFRITFGAATLHLQSNCGEENRAEQSSQHAAQLIDMLRGGGDMTGSEKDELASLVIATESGWVPKDRSDIVKALDEISKRQRRPSQEWCENVVNVFTQPDLDTWKARGASGMNSTLSEMQLA